jgi:outer membrane receptor for ferrienterochelin and colicin/copper chaperone CopZ
MKNLLLCAFLCTINYVVIGQSLVDYTFRVEGACGMCADRIEETAIKKGKAQAATYDLKSHLLTVTIDESVTDISEIKWELAQAGHSNGSFDAPEEIYRDLPLCCQYNDPNNPHKETENINTTENSSSPEVYLSRIEGYIYGVDADGEKEPLIGANVSLGQSGIGTTTDSDGYFSIDNSEVKATELEFSFIGYETQQFNVTEDGILDITLSQGVSMEEVVIKYKKRTTEVSFIKPLNVEEITREELCKAACCNLSESFETNPSVDVSYPDAVTGTRMIQMLGLAGPYVQITRELLPDVRAMSSVYGLSMTPGPWIESIHLIKGTGSVVNGYESIAGQINVDLKKPQFGERFFLNGYANNAGRLEINANARHQLSDNIYTGLLVHGKTMQDAHDNNGDGFTDMPIEKDIVVANRWYFDKVNNMMGQVGIKVSSLNHEGGFHDHFSGENVDHVNHWRMNSETKRVEVWSKIGYIFPNKSQNSIGLQLSGVYNDQESEFGFSIYNSEQKSANANLIYQNIISDSHTLRTGLSYNLDDVTERVAKAGFFDRYESVPGVFAEYTYTDPKNKFAIIPGLRVDQHNNYGTFITPRLHAKYNFSEKSIMRMTLGKGWRTASIFAENLGLFSTSRIVEVQSNGTDTPYGLQAEEAWTMGLNLTQGINIGLREMIISIDAYRTHFDNQIVVDYETARRVSFYNLEGQSYSNSIQLKVEYELLEDLNIRMAYRLFDVQTTYDDELLEKPLVSRHRAFINMAYKTKKDWHFDATINWNGSKRLPDTSDNPIQFQRPDRSPNYLLVNAQIMKRWNDKIDVYLGGENLFNYKQTDAIIASDDAFGEFFDASIVWAPLFGTNVYVGFRYTIPYE